MRRRAFRLARIGTQSRDLVSEAGRSKRRNGRGAARHLREFRSRRAVSTAWHWPKNTPTWGRLRLQKGCRHAGHLASVPWAKDGRRLKEAGLPKRFHLPPADNRTPANSPSDRTGSYTGAGVDEGGGADRALCRSHIIDERRVTGELLIRPGLLGIPRRF
jgi:hypothetical protein